MDDLDIYILIILFFTQRIVDNSGKYIKTPNNIKRHVYILNNLNT